MKAGTHHIIAPSAIIALLFALLDAQLGIDAAERITAEPWQIRDRGPNQNLWETTRTTVDPKSGRRTQRKATVVELGSGLNYLDETGNWIPAQETIELAADGAVAQQGQHVTTFRANLNVAGAIQIVMPDGQLLSATPLGLAYTDLATGNSVWLGELQDCQGEIHGPNQVLYPRAFGPLIADVRYTYTKAGLEQDVLLREQPKPPEDFGLPSATTVLECWTELQDQPAVQRETRTAATGLPTEALNFGSMRLVQGKAFRLGDSPESNEALAVATTLVTVAGRTFLIEAVPFTAAQARMNDLPVQQQAALHPQWNRRQPGAPAGLLPMRASLTPKGQPMQLAAHSIDPRGFVLDWTIVNGSLTNHAYLGDTTYVVGSPTYHYGTNVIEGGTVVRFSNSPTARLQFSGPVICKTAQYCPAIYSSVDDESVGEQGLGSGSPSGFYGETAIRIEDTPSVLSGLRFSRLRQAIQFAQGAKTNYVEHCQIVDCVQGVQAQNQSVVLRNVLFVGVSNAFNISSATATARCEQVTFNQVGIFNHTNASGVLRLYLTNCLIANLTNWAVGYQTNASANVGVASGSGIFNPVGGGTSYLPAGSSHRHAGTTNINSTLATALRLRTTTAPEILATTITNDVTLGPVVPRGSIVPDLGYHYDPIDYAGADVSVNGCVLTLLPGTALAGHTQYGLVMDGSARVVSSGTPESPNVFTRHYTVQDTTMGSWAGRGPFLYALVSSASRAVVARFTVWTTVGHEWHLQSEDYSTAGTEPMFALRDNQFFNGHLQMRVDAVALTNNLFRRAGAGFGSSGFGDEPPVNTALVLQNNTFFGGELLFANQLGNPWYAQDNVLDGVTAIYDWGSYSVSNRNNGYAGGSARFLPTNANDVVVTSMDWQTGPLGSFYQLTNSAFLDKGSTRATNVGLYHFTTTTNLVKEGVSLVDLGFHYVATSGTGVPLDSDGDGWYDWLEDANGNGVQDGVETSFNSTFFGSTNQAHQVNLRTFTPLR